MQTISGVSQLPHGVHKTVVTIGNFDGVHLGHQALIRKTKEISIARGLKSVVMTFKPHPLKILAPEREVHRIFSIEDQEEELKKIGIDIFVQQPFSRELSEMSAERFLNDILLKPLQPQAIIVGYDFAFGANREGSIGFLEKFCQNMQIELLVQEPVRVRGEIVSSSWIRRLVSEGEMQVVQECLGRYFYVLGVVERGAGRGRQIGFPTANVFTPTETFPRMGVYASFTHVQGRCIPSITNVGNNPTFSEATRRPIQIETHILDFDEDIYGDSIKVEFAEYLRSEKKFSSVEELVGQIKKDVELAREFHAALGINQST